MLPEGLASQQLGAGVAPRRLQRQLQHRTLRCPASCLLRRRDLIRWRRCAVGFRRCERPAAKEPEVETLQCPQPFVLQPAVRSEYSIAFAAALHPIGRSNKSTVSCKWSLDLQRVYDAMPRLNSAAVSFPRLAGSRPTIDLLCTDLSIKEEKLTHSKSGLRPLACLRLLHADALSAQYERECGVPQWLRHNANQAVQQLHRGGLHPRRALANLQGV